MDNQMQVKQNTDVVATATAADTDTKMNWKYKVTQDGMSWIVFITKSLLEILTTMITNILLPYQGAI